MVMDKERIRQFLTRPQLDFFAVTLAELDFLSQIDQYPELYEKSNYLKWAVYRYEKLWLPLMKSLKDTPYSMMPAPIDIEWVWQLHMMSPIIYQQDCNKLVGKLLDHKIWGKIPQKKNLKLVRQVWEQDYPDEHFELDLSSTMLAPPPVYTSQLSCNLYKAAERMRVFAYQVSLPHFKNKEFLKQAFQRYGVHLHLKAKFKKDLIVPPYDVHLMWKIHMLHPQQYVQDMRSIIGRAYDHEDALDPVEPTRALVQDAINTFERWEKLEQDLVIDGGQFRGIPARPLMDWNQMRQQVVAFHVHIFSALGKLSMKLDSVLVDGLGKNPQYINILQIKTNKLSITKKLSSKNQTVSLKKLGAAQTVLNKKDQWSVKVSRRGFFGACLGGSVIWKDNFTISPKSAFMETNAKGTGRKLEFKTPEFKQMLNLPKDILYGGMVSQIRDVQIAMQVRNSYNLKLPSKGGQIEIFMAGKFIFKSVISVGALVAEPDYMILPPKVFSKAVSDGKSCLRTIYFRSGVRSKAIGHIKLSRSRTLNFRSLEVYNFRSDSEILNTEHELTPLASSHLLDRSILPSLDMAKGQELQDMTGFLQQGERAMLIHSWTRGDFMLLIGKLNYCQSESRDQSLSAAQQHQKQIDDEDEQMAMENGEEYVFDEDYDADEDEGDDDDYDLPDPNTQQIEQEETEEISRSEGVKSGFVKFRGIWLTQSGYGESANIEFVKGVGKSSHKYVLVKGPGNPFGGNLTVDLKNNSFKVERSDLLEAFFLPEAITLAFSFSVLQTVLTLEDL
eukprot:TRINITY_DN6958_c0_g1_i1.p1 TRINITY_DN6958_c0_g1~~TRINITY_DN6958_c0_g1_i1.p1  ORF type:complete len:822 (-),score=120.16 TRINITY_DN6958_c0_g1_i1:282-2633(-)